MVQEGAAAAPALVGGAPGAAKKKKNKSKNKKKTGTVPVAGQPQQQQAGGSESRSRTSSDTAAGQSLQPNEPAAKPSAAVAAPIEPIVNRALPIAKEDRKADDLVSNLAREFAENYAIYSNYADVRDAEKLYYQRLAKNKVSLTFLELTFPHSLVEFPHSLVLLAWSLLPCLSFFQLAFSFLFEVFSTLRFCSLKRKPY